MKGQGLLRDALKKYGGDKDSFAKDVLGRSRVSVWRWQKKDDPTPIPEAVIARLRSYLQEK